MGNDNVQSFSDMVNGAEKLVRPWKILAIIALIAIMVTNAIWGYVHFKQLEFAYMTPTEWYQGQEFDEHTQSQRYSSGVTDGK